MFALIHKGTKPTFEKWYQMQVGTIGYQSTLAPVNIMGWRNAFASCITFDDWISITYRRGTQSFFKIYPATTLPGIPMLLNPINPKGTAILSLGYYKDTFALGLHKGKDALVQVKPVSVFRDCTKDDKIDTNPDSLEEGMFGINIHRAGIFSKLIGNWSAGCQVFKQESDFLEFLDICKQSGLNTFSYTLVGFVYD